MLDIISFQEFAAKLLVYNERGAFAYVRYASDWTEVSTVGSFKLTNLKLKLQVEVSPFFSSIKYISSLT